MLERFACWTNLERFKADAFAKKQEVKDANAQLRVNVEHAKKMAQVAKKLAPQPSGQYANRLLYGDIRQAELSEAVEGEQDNCLAALLRATLVRHGINAGHDSFIQLLEWKTSPMITDRYSTHVMW